MADPVNEALKEVGITEEIPETGATLDENASQKAHYVYERTGLDCFADDTGLEVEALNGAPGVRSARYATDGHDFAANNRKLLKELEGKTNRKARFRTVISLIRGGVEQQVELCSLVQTSERFLQQKFLHFLYL